MATDFLFGRSVYTLKAGADQEDRNRVFAESFEVAQDGLVKRYRLAPFHFLYNPPAFRKACRSVHQFVEEYIRESGVMQRDGAEDSKEKTSSSWFTQQIAKNSADERELRDQLLNLLLAGRDTTACCLSWTL